MKRLFFVTIVTSSLLTAAAAFAAFPEQLSIDVPKGFKAATGGALLMSARGVQQLPVTLQPESGGALKAVVRRPANLISEDAVLSAMFVSADGDVTFTSVGAIGSAHTKRDLPACAAERDPNLDFSGQYALLESLVRLRTQYRDGFRTMMANRLSSSSIEDLTKLEQLFGLSYREPLSADAPLPELLDRLSRLSEAIKNYKGHKARLAAK